MCVGIGVLLFRDNFTIDDNFRKDIGWMMMDATRASENHDDGDDVSRRFGFNCYANRDEYWLSFSLVNGSTIDMTGILILCSVHDSERSFYAKEITCGKSKQRFVVSVMRVLLY